MYVQIDEARYHYLPLGLYGKGPWNLYTPVQPLDVTVLYPEIKDGIQTRGGVKDPGALDKDTLPLSPCCAPFWSASQGI